MKLSLLTAAALSTGVQAHGFFQVSTQHLQGVLIYPFCISQD